MEYIICHAGISIAFAEETKVSEVIIFTINMNFVLAYCFPFPFPLLFQLLVQILLFSYHASDSLT